MHTYSTNARAPNTNLVIIESEIPYTGSSLVSKDPILVIENKLGSREAQLESMIVHSMAKRKLSIICPDLITLIVAMKS